MANFNPNASLILASRYLLPDETPDGFLERVSLRNPEYLRIMTDLEFLPNSPTLFNLGTGVGTYSGCFKFDIQDSLESIMDVARKAAFCQKWGGGVGYVLSELRPRGAPVGSTHRVALGPVGVMRILHSISKEITQGGRRNGAQMAILHVDHPDILEFIHCKDENPQALSTFNISVAITDEFMDHILNQQASIHEMKVWKAIAESAWRTGDPGLYFIDTAERANPTPYLGKLTGTNPCAEVPLLDNEACNLGSIDVGKFVTNGRIDGKRLEPVVRTAVRYLNEVLDRNTFPDPEITAAVGRTRKIGLGVMGWADALALMGIHYDTREAVNMGQLLMECINTWALEESIFLADKRGPYEPGKLTRNATRTCIAPTGTIALLAGCSSGIEPHYDIEWVRTMGDGTELTEIIPVMDRINGFRPHTAHEISPEWHIRMQAAFQRHTDLAVSKTVNMPYAAQPQDIATAFMMMWTMGVKGGTVYRDGCRATQVLNGGGSKSPVAAVGEGLPVDGGVGDDQLVTVGMGGSNPPLLHQAAGVENRESRQSHKLELMGSTPIPASMHGGSSLVEHQSYKLEDRGSIPLRHTMCQCGGKMVYQEGCETCAVCATSRCSL